MSTVRSRQISAFLGRFTVRQQFGVSAAALCVFVVAVIAGGTALLSARQTEAFVRQDLTGTAQALNDRLTATVSIRYREVGIFAGLEPMQPFWNGNQRALRTVLEQLQTSYPDFSWIGFASPDGTVVASTGSLLQGASVGQRPWFKNGISGPTLGDVHQAELLSKLLPGHTIAEPLRFIDVAFPVFNTHGDTLGVLGAHVSWKAADGLRRAMLATTDPDSRTELLIINAEGKVLLGGPIDSTPYTPAQLDRIRNKRSGTFVDKTASEPMLVAFSTTSARIDYPDPGWIIVARQPYATALAPVHKLVMTILALGVVAACLGVLLALFIAGRIARPIQALTRQADLLGREGGTVTLSRHDGSQEVVQLSTALRSLLRRIGVAEQKAHDIELRAAEGAEQYEHNLQLLRSIAETDMLTGLLNRRAFFSAANEAMNQFKRTERPLAALMIDIDHFKRVNDTFGHAAGDAVIKRVGETIGASLRSFDRAGRIGGEEFVVLLREADEAGASEAAARLRERIATAALDFADAHIDVTVSVGIALASATDRDIQDTIERADRGLYLAKNAGRNRVFFVPARGEAGLQRVA